MIVVDASLAAKWLLDEPGSPAADRFYRAHAGTLCGPDLLFTEVASALVRRSNTGELSPEDLLAALKLWIQLWHRDSVRAYRVTQPRLLEASKLAVTLRHPLPDCIYLGLAVELSCPLATCDAKFLAKAVRIYPAVRLLHDFELGDEDMLEPSRD